METETILIILGAILIAIGIVGGNLEWKEIKIPKIHIFARVLGFVTGLALIVVGPNMKEIATIVTPSNNETVSIDAQKAEEQRLNELQQQQENAQQARKIEEQKLALLLQQQTDAQQVLDLQLEQVNQPNKKLIEQKQQLVLLQEQQENTQKSIIAKKQQLSDLTHQIKQAQQQVIHVPTPTIESPIPEKQEVIKHFDIKRGEFENKQEYLDRLNHGAEQREPQYQVGMVHLTTYNVDTHLFFVSMDWQATWAKKFLTSTSINKHGYIRIKKNEAIALKKKGTEKPLFIKLKMIALKKFTGKGVLAGNDKNWPITFSRYIDNGNGTVTDTVTKLIWLKNADCFGSQVWNIAMSTASKLKSGQCDLTDDSQVGDWRLPTQEEWEAMVDLNFSSPALDITYDVLFTSVQSEYYWSSSIKKIHKTSFYMNLYDGKMHSSGWNHKRNVWLVKDKK